VAECRPTTVSVGVGAGQVAYGQGRHAAGADGVRAFALPAHLRVPGHGGDQVGARQVGHRGGHDVLGVAQDGHDVADLVDLLQVVADEQERHALALQVPHPPEQPVDRGAVELGGGLVEDDEPRPERQGPGDLHELPLFHREFAGEGLRIHVHRPGRQ
jgi:hypothetical protein